MGNSNRISTTTGAPAVGGAGGKRKGNRHLAYARDDATGNLLLSLLDLYGIEKDKQGDSTGRLAKLV